MHQQPNVEPANVRGKLLGAALLAFGVIAVSAYGFAAGGDPPKPATQQSVSTQEIRTTPDNPGSHEVPPPVASPESK